MAIIDHNAQIVSDSWHLLEHSADIAQARSANLGAFASAMLPLAAWLELCGMESPWARHCAVLLDGADDPAKLAPHLHLIERIAIRIPRFTDGRAYSAARLLRGRYAYRARLRALGDVQIDQLYYLRRVGFDSFVLRADQDLAAAQTALTTFSLAYQGAADPVAPLFRRRAALG